MATAAEPSADKPGADASLPATPESVLLPPGLTPAGAPAPSAAHGDAARPAAPAGPPPSSSPSPPTAQLAPALVHIAAAADGTQRVTVRLDPVELGQVHVRIERPPAGPVQVTVEATRPETLQMLRQDQPALHRALDQAGLPSDGRVVVLQQSSPDAGGQRQGASDTGSASAGSGGSQGGGRGGQGWSGSGGGDETSRDRTRRQDAWLRAGVDITA